MESIEFELGDEERILLPDMADIMKDKFGRFISKEEDDDNFRDNLKRTIKRERRTGNADVLLQNLSAVLQEALKDNDISLAAYQEDSVAFADYAKGEGSEDKIEFAKTTSLYDLFTDREKYLRMIGATSMKFDRDMQSFPKYDFDDYLDKQDLNKIFIESGISEDAQLYIYVDDFTKEFRQIIEDSRKQKLEDSKIVNLLFANPDFIDSLNIQYSFDKQKTDEDMDDIFIEIPEQPTNITKLASSFAEHYVQFIRDELGIRSGGFIPAGQYYASSGRDIRVSEVEYKPIGKGTSFTVDISDLLGGFDYKTFLEELKENFDLDDENNRQDIMAITVGKKIINAIKRSNFIREIIGSLGNIQRLKMYEIKANVSIPTLRKSDWKKSSESEKTKLLLRPLKNVKVTLNLREAYIGRFDFSYYSKAGEVKSDKMNDHLNEIRTKISFLSKFGVDGGI